MHLIPAHILHSARTRAGLSQRALAARAGTTQSVVTRIERGQASPTWETLTRLLAATGFDLDTRITMRPVARSHMLDDVSRILRLTPEQRLEEVANVSRFTSTVRRV